MDRTTFAGKLFVCSSVLALACVASRSAIAQQGGIDVPSGQPLPPSAQRAAASEKLAALIAAAQSELAGLEETKRAEAKELNEQIANATKDLFDIKAREIAATQKLRELNQEITKLDEKLIEAENQKLRAEADRESFENELQAQAKDFADRFETSLLGHERPQLVTRAKALTEDRGDDAQRDLADLLSVYDAVLDAAGVASTFRMPLRLPNANGRIEDVNVLRLGLLAGIYSHESSGETGFVQAGSEGEQGFQGVASGLTTAQRDAMRAFIHQPERGGFLPFDVTGGQGLATLQSSTTFAEWFEAGGLFMWALLAVAVTAVLFTIERAIVLSIRSAGIGLQIRKVLSLIDSGRIREADQLTSRIRGPAGVVLHAAVTHHGQDRAVVEDAVQEALLQQAPVFQTRLGFIALCAAISPLIGLLGTVTGMILTFKSITLFGTSDPRTMAGGISEALITTQGGLYVAIPCLLFRGVLGAVAESALGKLEAGAMAVVVAVLGRSTSRRAESDGGADDGDADDGDADADVLDDVERIDDFDEIDGLDHDAAASGEIADADESPIKASERRGR